MVSRRASIASPQRALAGSLITGTLMATALCYLVVRRLWFTGRQHNEAGVSHYLEFLQKAQRLPLDGDRTYSELSITWIVWYFGLIAVVLGIAGLSVLTVRVARSRQLPHVLVLGIWVFSAYYLYQPSVIPDQIWGVRRLEPIVMPGLLLAAAWLLSMLAGRAGLIGRPIAALLGVAMVVQTASASSDLAFIRQDANQLAEIQTVCAALPRHAAVVVTDELVTTYLQPVRSFCDVPTAGLTVSAGVSQLKDVRLAAALSGRRLFALTSTASALPGLGTGLPVISVSWRAWNATLTRRPDSAGRPSLSLWLAEVTSAGSVRDVTGPR